MENNILIMSLSNNLEKNIERDIDKEREEDDNNRY